MGVSQLSGLVFSALGFSVDSLWQHQEVEIEGVTRLRSTLQRRRVVIRDERNLQCEAVPMRARI